MVESLASWKFKSAGSRTYFFDLRETRDRNTFLQITESKPRGPDQEGFEQSRIFVFSEDFEEWFKMLGQVYRHLKAHPDQAEPPGRWDPDKRRERGRPRGSGRGNGNGATNGYGRAAPRERRAGSREPAATARHR